MQATFTGDGGLLPRIRHTPLIAILRARSADRFVEASRVLVETGIECLEYTLTSAGAIEAVGQAREALPDHVLVGVGTVRSRELAERAADAGADFLVSQIHDTDVVAASQSRGIPFIPGALTPSEIVRAWASGVEAVKVSPVGPLGGPSYLREVRAPLPDIPLIPTGGVQLSDIRGYLEVGAIAVGLSAPLFLGVLDASAPMDLDGLRRRALQAVADARAYVASASEVSS